MGFPKGHPLAHDFAEQSVVCYTLCRRCRENAVAAGVGNDILKRQESEWDLRLIRRKSLLAFVSRQGVYGKLWLA